ncbi:hypothetical protein FPCIR_379 [Fusarium pseudocircinatum]|uniref:F-box domain-containing protein n=1 Tax=Fusarium pseudocircinatum TaxID=56676 RepID=A0A8H5UZX2_9HYPO|nr:hypothetical protein FPCIR_379 [Fusarium pseudocircinatum]
MRLVGLVAALAALAEAQLPETPGANGESTTTTLHPLPFETTSSEIPVFDMTTSSDGALPETSTGVPVPDIASTSTDILPELSESKSTDFAVGGTSTANNESPLDSTSSGEVPVGQPTTGTGQPTGPETTAQLPPAIDTTTSQGPLVAETTTQQPPVLDTATTDQTPAIEPTSQQPPAPQSTTEQGPAVDTTTQPPPAQDSTTEQLVPQDTTSQPFAGEETTSTQAPIVVATSSAQPVDEVPSTTEKPEDPKPTTTKQEEAEPTSKGEESDPKSEDSDNEDPKTKDETGPEPTTQKDEAPPVTVPPAAVTAEPQETISGVSDNTLHSTKDSDGNDVVVPVLFGPSCLIFCEHAGKDNGPGGIVLWGIGPAPGSYVLPPLPGITPAPSAVVIEGGVPTPVGTQTPEDPDDQEDDDDDDDKSTAEEETKTEAKSTAESSAASTTEASTTELPQLSMGVETVVVNVDATPTTGATSSEATTEATSTEASTQTTELPQLSMGVDTVVVDVDATPTTGGTTETSAATSTETTEATTQTTELPQLSMGVDTVVVDVDATPTTGGTTETSAESTTTEESSTEVSETAKTQDTTTAEMTSTEATTAESTTAGPTSTENSVQSTTFATSTTTREPEREYPCIIHANPGIDPYCACETTVSGKGFYVSTDLISSSCADYTTFPSSIPTDAFEPKVTEKPNPEPFVKTDDGTIVSYPDRTVKVGNYPGGKYTYTQGVGDGVTLETPLPTQTDANNKGSSQCGSIDDACDRALNDGFDDETTYTDYVSRYARIKSGMIMVASFGQAGCTAQFKCDDYGLGMKGKDIKDAVQHMKGNDGVSKCGTAYLSNTCQITLNYCTNFSSFILRVTMRSDYDVSHLMYGAQTAAEFDFYDGEPEPRLEPLLLDTVIQGRPPASNCRLLQMPNEILAKIANFVAEDEQALQELALVNSDCCGLSRACLFSEFEFDYSPEKIKLLLNLAQGILAGRTGPGIQDCIRKFIFRPDPYEDAGPDEIKEEGAVLFRQIQYSVALNLKAMRNLETLVWDCRFPLDKDSWSLLACSTAHNLLLNDTLIAENFSLEPPLTPPSWPLRSLVLMNVRLVGSWDQEHSYRGEGVPLRSNPTNDFFKSLFQRCSQNLESLTWESWHPEGWELLSLGTDSNTFPKLRKLRMRPGRAFRLFEDIIRSHVKEPYRDLEELSVEFDDNQQLITELILKHNDSKKLWVTQSYYMSGRDNSFDRVLIPSLGKGRFNNLRSLYIQWGGQNKDADREADRFDIMPESLAAICELTTLEQLGLRCDEMIPEFTSYEDYTEDTYPIWLIDHGKLQAHLQSLKNLKMLVIRGDTYPPRANEVFGHRWYYRSNFANQEDLQTAKDHPELAPFVQGDDEPTIAWNHAHLYRILEYARAYRKVLPKLEWMLCGQRPMKFMENAHGVVQPYPVDDEMDECKTFIGRVFGLSSEVEIAHLKN